MTKFSWPRCFVHIGLGLLVAGAAGAALVAALGSRTDAERLGYIVGMLAVGLIPALLLISASLSYLAQTGRRATALGVAVGLLAGGYGALFAAARTTPPAALSESERVALVVRNEAGSARLHHPELGFSFPHPGPEFVESPEAVSQLGNKVKDPGTQMYVYAAGDQGSAFIVTIMKNRGATEAAFRQVVADLERGAMKSTRALMAPGTEIRSLRHEIDWNQDQGQARIHVVAGEQLHWLLLARTLQRPGALPFIVLLSLTTPLPDRYAHVLDGFR